MQPAAPVSSRPAGPPTHFPDLHAAAVRSTSTSTAATASMGPTSSPQHYRKVLVQGTINPAVESMEYAVRGQLVIKAERYNQRLAQIKLQKRAPTQEENEQKTRTSSQHHEQEHGHNLNPTNGHSEDTHDLPFDRIIYCNIGNPQSVGQKPVTFLRQVLAAVVCPDLLLGNPQVAATLPADVVRRANAILESSHGVGAYSESRGIPFIRKNIAQALQRRDGNIPADPDNIFLTNGASEAVKTILSLLIRNGTDGVMIPIPQYPLYSATMHALGGHQVGYYLDEANGWSLSVEELQTRLSEAQDQGVNVRALCVINPGNPTGQSLSHGNIVDIVRFCEQNNLVLMADEVYQRNIYDGSPFVSFKKVVCTLESPVELASFNSVSKGFTGECGLRGGYVELHNFDPHTMDVVYKVQSVSLCAGIPGQIAVDLMMNPPQPGDPSYDLYVKETTGTIESLGRKARKLASALNSFDGVHCNPPQGAMYLFPQVTMPDGAKRRAAELKLASPDVLYSLELLDETGICVVPGSGFGQVAGTFHFRTTFLPPEDEIDNVISKMDSFHRQFMERYAA